MPTFIRPLAGLLAFLLVVAVGPERVQTRDQAPAGYPAMGSPAIVKLLAPGADPKTPLRYKVPAGFKTSGVVSLTMGLTMNMAGMALPAMDLPTMKMTFSVDVVWLRGGTGLSVTGSRLANTRLAPSVRH